MLPAILQGSVNAAGGRQQAGARAGPGKTGSLALIAATMLAIFVCDWFVELGVAIGVAYVLVIWLADTLHRQQFLWTVALLCSGLVVVGFLKSPDGGELWKVLANRGLSLIAIWSTMFFVLQRRKAHRQLAAANDRLEASNDALTQSNIDLQQFAYVASHDLQTPLRHIGGFVQLLQKEYDDKLDDDAREWIGHTVTGVDRMQTLIRDLLTFSRVESRSQPFADVDLNDVIDATFETFAAEKATITRSELPVLTGDRSQLVHLVQNLIGNGIKYSGEQSAEVHVSAEALGDEWRIAVRDNGIGIEERHHKRIFEIFRRLHTAQEYPGTGIGLAVCRRIVQRHGGRIWVESQPGSGSTFYFTLPAGGA